MKKTRNKIACISQIVDQLIHVHVPTHIPYCIGLRGGGTDSTCMQWCLMKIPYKDLSCNSGFNHVDEGMAQLEECLVTMDRIIGSNPSNTMKTLCSSGGGHLFYSNDNM